MGEMARWVIVPKIQEKASSERGEIAVRTRPSFDMFLIFSPSFTLKIKKCR